MSYINFQMVTMNLTFDDLSRSKWPKSANAVVNCLYCHCSYELDNLAAILDLIFFFFMSQ